MGNTSPPAALKRKADDKILQQSGTMRDSLAYQFVGEELHFGSNQEYAAAHQFGYEDIPARPFIGLFDAL